MKFYNFIIVIEEEEDGEGYYAYSPNLPGCYSNGKTVEETHRNSSSQWSDEGENLA